MSADDAVAEFEIACRAQLARTPTLYRRSGKSPNRPELVILFGASGYVALFDVLSIDVVLVTHVRHQREDDLA